jgi:hypothetical protein
MERFNYDATTARIHWGGLAIPGFTSISLPKQERKSKKEPLIGSMYATVRTPGFIEIGECACEFMLTGWQSALAQLPDQYGSIEFPITVREQHPQIRGSFSTILDRCSIQSVELGKIAAGDESHRKVAVTFQVVMVFERGADGTWKTIGRRPGARIYEASAQAKALMG